MKLPEKQNESQADKGSQHIPQHVTARGDNVTVHPPHHKKRPPCHSNLIHMHSHTHTVIKLIQHNINIVMFIIRYLFICSALVWFIFVINSYLIRINLLLYIKLFYGHHWQSTVYQQCLQIIQWPSEQQLNMMHHLEPFRLCIMNIMNALYLTATSDNITINILYQINHFDKWCCLFWSTKLSVFLLLILFFFYFLCLCISPPTFSPKKNIILTYSQPINNLTSGFITRS